MNGQLEAAWRLHLFFTARRVPYVIIGGIAVQRWGQPRLTRDVDLTILLPPGREEGVLREIVGAFPPRIDGAVDFALKHRVLPISVPEGSEADISLGLPGYEEHAMARAIEYDLGDGRRVRLCSAEDLIIHKALAGPPQDLLDIEGIVARQGGALDVAYLRRWLEELGRAADDPGVAAHFDRAWARHGPHGSGESGG
ncbi:MAG TPA: hypothetical protein VFN71_10235 [Methylomirabilota bacterium]|nr:hypothetical protein [Methylomirabilota bacterium]